MHVIRSFNVGLALLALLGLGCASYPKAPRMGPEDYPNATAPLSRQRAAVTAGEVPPDPAIEYLEIDHPDLQEPMRQFMETGRPPVIRHKDRRYVRYPFGHSDPLLYCKPLRVCDIQLQAGESVLHIALGDSERWIASKMESGPADGRAPHVVVKPTEFDVSTNLVITTDRRVYHLGLISNQEDRSGYFRSVRFYYPQETVQRWASAEAKLRDDVHRKRDVARLPLVSPEGLNFGYRIEGDRVPWRPVQAFDDGTRVFLQMSGAMAATEAPALFVRSASEDQALVNYRLRGRYFVVDKLFAQAVLVLGIGGDQKRITVTRLPRETRR